MVTLLQGQLALCQLGFKPVWLQTWKKPQAVQGQDKSGQGLKDLGILRFKDLGIYGFGDLGIQGLRHIGIYGFIDSDIEGFGYLGTQGLKD